CRWATASEQNTNRPPLPRKTHCKWGHSLTPENVHMKVGGGGAPWRLCRTCQREWRLLNLRKRRLDPAYRAEEANRAQARWRAATPENKARIIALQREARRKRRQDPKYRAACAARLREWRARNRAEKSGSDKVLKLRPLM